MADIVLKFSELIIPAFHEVWKAFKNPAFIHYFLSGGRGSSKSTTAHMAMVRNRMTTMTHGLCVRKYATNLRKSVRNQCIWCIMHMKAQDDWHWSNAEQGDMTLTYKPTGTKIYFEGADGEKVKGWKTPDMPTTDILFEEITNFKTDEELSSIVLSIMREKLPAGYKYSFFYCFNPAKRKQHWANKKVFTQFKPANMYHHHSDYRTNPHLPQEFLDEAAAVRGTGVEPSRRYKWEFLGEPIGSGIVPFDNLVFRTITDAEIAAFDNFRQGNDWGYAVDPNAFVNWHYDKTRKTIYAINEIYGIKLSNTELARQIRALGLHLQETVADSAEPKSIDQLRDLGCNFTGAKKGPGSVEYGEKWLDELDAIVIDPDRTPELAREFEGIDYQTDKDGNPKPRLDDEDNHGIDATRYAFEDDMTTDDWGW